MATKKVKARQVDLTTKVLSEGGIPFFPLRGLPSTFKCFKDKKNGQFKICIELTFEKGVDTNLKQLGDILGPDGKPLTEQQIKDQKGWIFFPKFQKLAAEIQDGSGHFIFEDEDKARLNLSIQLKDSGKTQSGT